MSEPLKDEIGWTYWQAAIKGEFIPYPAKAAPIGYYRKLDRKTGKWEPIGIWFDKDVKVVQVGRKPKFRLDTAEKEEDFGHDTFSRIAKFPVSYADYQHWLQNGAWPAERNPDTTKKPPEARREPPAVGHNSGAPAAPKLASLPAIGEQQPQPQQPAGNAAEAFLDQVTSALAGIEACGKIDTQELAEQAQGLRSRLTSLATEGDKAHEQEKAPHLAAGRAVDAAWKPNIKKARDGASTLKRGIDAFLSEAKRAEEEAKRAALLAADPIVEKPTELVLRGTQGRAARVKEVVDHEIIDMFVVFQQFEKNGELIYLLNTLVGRVKAAGSRLPGVKYTTRYVAT